MKQLFQAVAKASDGAFVIDQDYRIVFWNQAAESILGITSEKAKGRHCYQVLGGRDEHGRTLCQRNCRIALNTARGRTPPNIDIHALGASGEGRWINLTTFAYPAGNPSTDDVIVHLFRDASEKKSTERFVVEIIEASRKLREDKGGPNPVYVPARTSSDPGLISLTPRQTEVLLLLGQGLSTAEISGTLNISSSTTRNHIQNIMRKLGVHSRLEAVAYAYQHGLADASR